VVRLAATVSIEGSFAEDLAAVEQGGILLALEGVSHSCRGTLAGSWEPAQALSG
jgi:hypothetical protein